MSESTNNSFFTYVKNDPYLSLAMMWMTVHNRGNCNPYHNLRHSTHVAEMMYDAYFHLEDKSVSQRAMVVAGLFHDANHSGIMGGMDALEIKSALDFFENFQQCTTLIGNVDYDSAVMPLSEAECTLVKRLIQSTEFPYAGKPSDELAAVMRDADLSQIYEEDFFNQIYYGIATEMGMPVQEFLLGQENYLKSFKPFSTWGKKLYDKNIDTVMWRYETVAKIFKIKQ